MHEYAPYIWDVVKWAAMAIGSIVVGWAALQRNFLQMQITISNLTAAMRDSERKIQDLEKKIEVVNQARNSESLEVSQRLASVEAKMESLPRLEAKLDMMMNRRLGP